MFGYTKDSGERNGGDEEDRTPGLGIANAALSQLSYIPRQIKSKKAKGKSQPMPAERDNIEMLY